MIKIDIKELDYVSIAAGKFREGYGKAQLKGSFRKGLKPMLTTAQSEVPIGYNNTRSSLGRSAGKARDKGYDRGGATKRDLRILVQDAKYKLASESEIAGLVGVSKKRDSVGWRTHFITRGVKGGIDRRGRKFSAQPARDFLGTAYGRNVTNLVDTVKSDLDAKVKKLTTDVGKKR